MGRWLVLRMKMVASWACLTCTAFAAFLLFPAFVHATNAGIDERVMREAAELERKGDWRGAAEAYWKVLAQNRSLTEARDKYLHCLRRLRLVDRHNDPNYRKRIQDLALSKSLS